MLSGLELIERVARGGSATVWRARHMHTNHPLAVKFLRREWRDRGDVLLAEAEALSRLDHRHIATIFDVGHLEKALEIDGEEIAAQTPYIVMEWADQGTSLANRGGWERGHLTTVLDQTLGALAHIHALGLLHLDIKPSNVLLSSHEDRTRAEVRVVDLGLWSLRGEDGQANFGTPGYMAPERRASAQADLYGVGMMALVLAGAVLPHEHDDAASASALAAFSPQWRAWIERCIAHDPRERFSSAALAREALASLDTIALPLPLRSARTFFVEDDTTAYSTMIGESLEAMTLGERGVAWREPVVAVSDSGELGVSDVPTFPADWRLPHTPRAIRRLAGTGRGVFAQRELRFVGRIEERERLWRMLETSEQTNTLATVCIDGEEGIGRSALAAWFGRRVVELTGGCLLEVVAVEGRRKLEAYLDVIDRLEDGDVGLTRAIEVRSSALREAIRSAATGGRVLVEEWQALELCRDMLAHIASHTRVLLHFQNIEPSGAFHNLFESLRSDPLEVGFGAMVLATHVDDEIVQDIPEQQLVRLEPPPHEIAAIINQSLGLDPMIIDELARRSGGNPGFVRRMILGWLRRGWLEEGSRGLTLGSWDDPWLPPETLTLEARVEDVLEASSEEERRALAALVLVEQAPGLEDRAEHREGALERSLSMLGLRFPEGLYARLLLEDHARRARGHASRPRLTRELLVVLERALEDVFASSESGVVATVLEALDPALSDARATTFRLWRASALARAKDGQGALDMLRRSLIAGLDPEVATRCLELVEQLERAGVGASDPHARQELLLLRARALYSLGDHDADAVLDELGVPGAATPLASRFAYHEMRLIALLGRGLFKEAKEVGAQLERMLEEAPVDGLRARIYTGLARLAIHSKDFPSAIEHARAGSEICENLNEPLIELSVRNMYAIALQESGGHDLARPQLERCFELAQTLGSSRFQVMALNSLGDLEMRQKQWAAARHWLRQGLEVGRHRYPLAAYLHGNLAWAALNEEDALADEALEHIDEALSRLADEPSIVRTFLIELRQYALAMLDQPVAWDACMSQLDELLEQLDAAHEEGVAGAMASAELWRDRGDSARAERALEMATRLKAAFA